LLQIDPIGERCHPYAIHDHAGIRQPHDRQTAQRYRLMINGPTIDYDALAQDAMREVVRTILTAVAKDGLPGEHHFYVSFDTQAPGVSVSRRLREKHPDEMTIVLQHRFWDLIVTEDRFEVKLTFDGIPEKLVVPFRALRVFYDPSVRYALQFEDQTAASPHHQDGEAADTASRALIVSMQPDGATATGRSQGRSPTGERKPRAARKPKLEKAASGEPGAAEASSTSTPGGAVGRVGKDTATPPPTAKGDGAPAPAADVPAATAPRTGEAAKDAGGAQIVRLDTFRKK
jgi:hypothetical protein